MVHLGSFLLAIVSKNVHFSHYCVSRVSWAPVESAHTGTWEWHVVSRFGVQQEDLVSRGCMPDCSDNGKQLNVFCLSFYE